MNHFKAKTLKALAGTTIILTLKSYAELNTQYGDKLSIDGEGLLKLKGFKLPVPAVIAASLGKTATGTITEDGSITVGDENIGGFLLKSYKEGSDDFVEIANLGEVRVVDGGFSVGDSNISFTDAETLADFISANV